MSRPQLADSARYGSNSVSSDGGRTLACSRAASGSTHGEIVVPNDLPRNGPRGTDSHAWMSLADQSLTRHTPNTCSVKRSTVTGSPSTDSAPTTKPSSASKSSLSDGPKAGPLVPAGLRGPYGGRTGVPDMITVPARP